MLHSMLLLRVIDILNKLKLESKFRKCINYSTIADFGNIFSFL